MSHCSAKGFHSAHLQLGGGHQSLGYFMDTLDGCTGPSQTSALTSTSAKAWDTVAPTACHCRPWEAAWEHLKKVSSPAVPTAGHIGCQLPCCTESFLGRTRGRRGEAGGTNLTRNRVPAARTACVSSKLWSNVPPSRRLNDSLK